jgi:hypothetical protein
MRSRFTAIPVAIFALASAIAHGQTPPATQTFALTDIAGLQTKNLDIKAVDYKGRKSIELLTTGNNEDGLVFLPGTDFQDGTIEADIALKITTPPGVRMPGFVGIGFRARPDGAHYDMFYIRPGNSHAADQAMRNHSVQYVAEPDFDWYRLRREWPFVYESYAPLELETWTHVKIEVKGRSATLYLNRASEPSLIVNGLRGQDLRGAVALWGYQGEEAYFSNVRITNATPEPVKNGSDSVGTWKVQYKSDAGVVNGTLKLARDGEKLSGTWSGDMGNDLPLQGTWRDGYVDFTFSCTWGKDTSQSIAHLAGWIDGDSAQGRMEVVGRADGPWTAARQP